MVEKSKKDDSHIDNADAVIVSEESGNYYDDPKFHECYMNMRLNTCNANEYIERPYLERLLPDMKDSVVLDLGCGTGNYIILHMQGAKSVDAVDVSEKMLNRLERLLDDNAMTNVNVIRSSLEEYEFRKDYYDVVISTLAFHYVADLQSLFRRISYSLKRDGVFIFNVEHPVYTAAKKEGWVVDKGGELSHWRMDDYFDTGVRHALWFGVKIKKYHRTIEDYFRLLIDNGFKVIDLLEPKPDNDIGERCVELNEHLRRPTFLMFSAIKERRL